VIIGNNSDVWCFLQVPPTLRFVLDGEMPKHLLAKDLILQVWLPLLTWSGSFCVIKVVVEVCCNIYLRSSLKSNDSMYADYW
jgi:homoaconitase/3-isopropylmalate dehydratase large subunit